MYHELRSLAHALRARETPGLTMQATDLVHEAYIRVLGNDDADWTGRAHFFAAAAEAMRRILIEQARRKAALKYGGGRQRVPLEEGEILTNDDGINLLELNDALQRLEEEDATKAALVKLRHFTGMTLPQAAHTLGISRATAARYWVYSRARLHQLMTGAAAAERPAGEKAR